MLALERHPDSRGAEAVRIEVEARRPAPGVLALRYLLQGGLSGLRLPPPAAPERTDELWRHTCFEAFAQIPGDDGYYEFNFAPSSQWAVYRFTGHRAGMTAAPLSSPPMISGRHSSDGYELEVRLDAGSLDQLPTFAAWRLGITAVIEDLGGAMSYWALVHPPGKPDFHHSDGFVAELTPTDL